MICHNVFDPVPAEAVELSSQLALPTVLHKALQPMLKLDWFSLSVNVGWACTNRV